MSNRLSREEAITHDLTIIKGIGEATQQWLRERMAVNTYDDLAIVSPDDLEERLREDGKIASRNKVESWISQAKELASLQKETFDIELTNASQVKTEDKLDDSLEWKIYATFVVEFKKQQTEEGIKFQTKAHHMEADNNYKWSGIVQEELGRWIAQQLGVTDIESLQSVDDETQSIVKNKVPEFADELEIIMPELIIEAESIQTSITQKPSETELISLELSDDLFSHSDKLKQIMATVQKLTSVTQTVYKQPTPQVPQPQESEVSGAFPPKRPPVYSDKLRQVIATTKQLAVTDIGQQTQLENEGPDSRSSTFQIVNSSTIQPTRASLRYSDKLQQVLDNVRRLTNER